jgi:hypothetical protein
LHGSRRYGLVGERRKEDEFCSLGLWVIKAIAKLLWQKSPARRLIRPLPPIPHAIWRGGVRRCPELDPAYCDQIVRRFGQVVGKQAILAATGQRFEVVAEERGLGLAPPIFRENVP